MRVKKLLKTVLGLCESTVVIDAELDETGPRPTLFVWVRTKARRRGRCGRCGALAGFYDRGGRPERQTRRWRHLDVGYATSELVAIAPRVDCAGCGVTVAGVPWARHGSSFTRAFEDLVCWEAVVASKQTAVRRYGISWRAVNNICVRVATEMLDRVDLLDGLVAVAIDEVKYKKGQRYLTVVCDHLSGRVVWASEGRSQATVTRFFNDLGPERAAQLSFVTADGAEWIHTIVAEHAPDAIVCIDTFHVIGWATRALDDVRRHEWNRLRRTGGARAARQVKGLRWILLRNWQNLNSKQRDVIRDLEATNRRLTRGYQLKEELREIFAMPILAAQRALDEWLAWASRSKLEPFVKLARSIRRYRPAIEATIEWRLTNGLAESNNSAIGRIRTNARGFHKPASFITMIMLERAGLTPQLPWTTAA